MGSKGGSQVEEKQITTVDRAVFFELVDEVLMSLGRDALQPGSSQREVVEIKPDDRVLQILAGPGSGKTEMLVWRVLYELLVLGTPSSRVMVTTFTRRAATELQVRVVERCDEFLKRAHARGLSVADPHVHDLRIGTIHSLCDSLLAEFDPDYMQTGTQLIDDTEVTIRIARHHRFALGRASLGTPPRLVDRLLATQALVALFRPPWEDVRWPSTRMEEVDVIKALLAQHAETWLPRCETTGRLNGIEVVHHAVGLTNELVELHGRWQEYLAKNHVLDFASVQTQFFARQAGMIPGIAHVFVDEFQDNNPIQFAIHTRWLEGSGTRLTVVGDDDQAIYRFRGSDIGCFQDLEPHCLARSIAYRRETLGVNYRSTDRIVRFCQEFKERTVLRKLSMPKTVTASPSAARGAAVRLLEGRWSDVCQAVAKELARTGAGRVSTSGTPPVSAALLMFSTSERESQSYRSPALALRTAVEEVGGVRVYNPRNKMAATPESPVSMLLGLLSYLIDPVTKAPAGKNGRLVEVWGCSSKPAHIPFARTMPPPFKVNEKHIDFQKKFFKGNGGAIGAPHRDRVSLVQCVDQVRDELVRASAAGRRPRLTLAGFVARLLADPFFRRSGFTLNLFRQAMFTSLLEANIAPTRLSAESLDQPLECTAVAGKFVWPGRFWELLSHFGGYLDNAKIDDPEVEAFEENAVLMITFHQAKGLEFDHVYVAGTGRSRDVSPALRTRLFSGEPVPYTIDTSGAVQTSDNDTIELATADREREVYVALTRAKQTLTIISDPNSSAPFMALNPAIAALFANVQSKPHVDVPAVSVKEFVS